MEATPAGANDCVQYQKMGSSGKHVLRSNEVPQ